MVLPLSFFSVSLFLKYRTQVLLFVSFLRAVRPRSFLLFSRCSSQSFLMFFLPLSSISPSLSRKMSWKNSSTPFSSLLMHWCPVIIPLGRERSFLMRREDRLNITIFLSTRGPLAFVTPIVMIWVCFILFVHSLTADEHLTIRISSTDSQLDETTDPPDHVNDLFRQFAAAWCHTTLSKYQKVHHSTFLTFPQFIHRIWRKRMNFTFIFQLKERPQILNSLHWRRSRAVI